MSRSSLAFALLVLAACKQPKGVQVDARELVPLDATGAFGFELEPVRSSPLGALVHGAMQTDAEMKAMTAAIADCNVDLANLRGMFATVLDNDDRVVAVIEAPKIGNEDTVRCIEKGFARGTGKSDSGLILFDTRGEVRTLAQEGGGFLVILDENAIAVVDKPWEEQFFASLENPAARNTTTPLAKAVAKVDPSNDVWFAMALSDSDRANFSDVQGADGVSTLTAFADLAKGLKLDIVLEARDAANAKQIEGSLRTTLDEAKPGLASAGLPATLLDQTKVTSKDAQVTTTIEIAADALPGILTALAPFMAAP
ncbi:MAG TPA: hypothetical protein VG755_03345 [Nannocystaceae bacterium]|nr:hypothetical protein [Nannocystaceae bacterium]